MDIHIKKAESLDEIPRVARPIGRGERETKSIGADEPPHGSTSRPLGGVMSETPAQSRLRRAWRPMSLAGLVALGAWYYRRRDRSDFTSPC